MEFDDFAVRIGRPDPDGTYPVHVVRSEGGEPGGAWRLPFAAASLERRLEALNPHWRGAVRGLHRSYWSEPPEDEAAPPASESAREFGSALFSSLMAGDVGTAYRVSRQRASDTGRGLRIRLRTEDPALAGLPWELLYDEVEADFVCLSNETPLVRHLEISRAVDRRPIERPLRILGMIAEPTDLARLNVGREKARMARALKPAIEAGTVELEWLNGQTWRDLLGALRTPGLHVFHFVGHGMFDEDGGALALADDSGRSALLGATELARLLGDHPTLRLAVLNACEGARGDEDDLFSSTASTLIRRGLPAVIAMQHAISDAAAIEFSRELYSALVEGWPIDAAVGEGRKAMSLAADTIEWATPVLHMRSADGVLFPRRGLSGRPTGGDPGTSGNRPASGGADQESSSSVTRGVQALPLTGGDVDPFRSVPGLGSGSSRGWYVVLGAIGLALVGYALFLVLSS